jgi:hypothetical protein
MPTSRFHTTTASTTTHHPVYQLSCSQKSCLPFSRYFFPTQTSVIFVIPFPLSTNVKAQLFVYVPLRNTGGGEVWLHSFLTPELDFVEWPASRTGNHHIVVWVGLRASLDILGKIKFPCACGDSNLVLPSPQSSPALRAALVTLSRSVLHFLGVKGTALPSL